MTNPTISAENRAKLALSDGHKIRAWGAEHLVAEQIRQAEQAAYERAAMVASGYTGPGTRNVHPDVRWEDMNEPAQHVSHTTAQGIAFDIRALAQEPEEVG